MVVDAVDPLVVARATLEEGRVSGYVTKSGKRVSSYVRGTAAYKRVDRVAKNNVKSFNSDPARHRRKITIAGAGAAAAYVAGTAGLKRGHTNGMLDRARAHTVNARRSLGDPSAKFLPHRWEGPRTARARAAAADALRREASNRILAGTSTAAEEVRRAAPPRAKLGPQRTRVVTGIRQADQAIRKAQGAMDRALARGDEDAYKAFRRDQDRHIRARAAAVAALKRLGLREAALEESVSVKAHMRAGHHIHAYFRDNPESLAKVAGAVLAPALLAPDATRGAIGDLLEKDPKKRAARKATRRRRRREGLEDTLAAARGFIRGGQVPSRLDLHEAALAAAEDALEEVNVSGYVRTVRGKAVRVRRYVRGQGRRAKKWVKENPAEAATYAAAALGTAGLAGYVGYEERRDAGKPVTRAEFQAARRAKKHEGLTKAIGRKPSYFKPDDPQSALVRSSRSATTGLEKEAWQKRVRDQRRDMASQAAADQAERQGAIANLLDRDAMSTENRAKHREADANLLGHALRYPGALQDRMLRRHGSLEGIRKAKAWSESEAKRLRAEAEGARAHAKRIHKEVHGPSEYEVKKMADEAEMKRIRGVGERIKRLDAHIRTIRGNLSSARSRGDDGVIASLEDKLKQHMEWRQEAVDELRRKPMNEAALAAAYDALEEVNVRAYTRRVRGKAVHVRDYVRGQGVRAKNFALRHPATTAQAAGLGYAAYRFGTPRGRQQGKEWVKGRVNVAKTAATNERMLKLERERRDAEDRARREKRRSGPIDYSKAAGHGSALADRMDSVTRRPGESLQDFSRRLAGLPPHGRTGNPFLDDALDKVQKKKPRNVRDAQTGPGGQRIPPVTMQDLLNDKAIGEAIKILSGLATSDRGGHRPSIEQMAARRGRIEVSPYDPRGHNPYPPSHN